MLAKVAIIEYIESTEPIQVLLRYTVLANVAIIEYTESTENWRAALSGTAEVDTQCLQRLQQWSTQSPQRTGEQPFQVQLRYTVLAKVAVIELGISIDRKYREIFLSRN